MTYDTNVVVCTGEAAVRWDASQASGLKLNLEAQLEAASLPKIAIEVWPSDVLGASIILSSFAKPAQHQMKAGDIAAGWQLHALAAAQHSVSMLVDSARLIAGGRSAPLCQQHWRPAGQDAGQGPPPQRPRLGGEQLAAAALCVA